MLIHKQQPRNTMLNDDSSLLGCHAMSKGYAVPDILKHCRAFRMSGPNSLRISHMQQHGIMNCATLIISDMAVRTSNARMFYERGWIRPPLCCSAYAGLVGRECCAMSMLGSGWLLSRDNHTSVTDWPTALELTLKWPLGPWLLQASCYMPTSLLTCICTYTWRMGSSNFSSLVEYRQCCSVKWSFMSIMDLILL